MGDWTLKPDSSQQRIAELFESEWLRFVGYVRGRASIIAEMDAEDVVADVLENLLRRTDLTAHVGNIVSYAYRSIANKVVDYLESRRNTVSLDEPQPDRGRGQDAGIGLGLGRGRGLGTGGESGSRYQYLPDRRAQPDEQTEQAYIRQRLVEAISRLEPRQRAVWLATEIHGRSFKELATAWGEPVGTLLSRKSRANALLRSYLSDLRSPVGR